MKKTIYALGFFDGVHLGHGALLTACHVLAKQTGSNVGVVTFTTHPDAMVLGKAPTLINTPEDRKTLLREYAVGVLGLLCLMMCFVSYIFGFRGRNTYVFLFAIALIGLSMMTEAILERQAGVHFCAFAFCWFVPFMKRNKTKKIRTA